MNNNNLYRPTEQFSRKLHQVKQSDPHGYKRIRQVVERLLAEPDDADVGANYVKRKIVVWIRSARIVRSYRTIV